MTLDQFILAEQINLESFRIYALTHEDLTVADIGSGDWVEQYMDYVDSGIEESIPSLPFQKD